VAFKSIAAYRSGLRINPLVSAQESEDALHENLRWGSPVRVSQKALVDFIFIRALEVATQRGIPMQIHTGYVTFLFWVTMHSAWELLHISLYGTDLQLPNCIS
jgi:hypothetical protein